QGQSTQQPSMSTSGCRRWSMGIRVRLSGLQPACLSACWWARRRTDSRLLKTTKRRNHS
ncbi:hypothetical protein LPJ75_005638, partial [Coemansia sp. RSA 2598]